MVTEHVFAVKQPGTTRMAVVERAGFASADRRTASVCLPGLRARRSVVARFASTGPEVHAAGLTDERARWALDRVCAPRSRQARADAPSAAVDTDDQ